MSEFITCRHIKTNGKRCKSPALTGKALCFFHAKLYKQHRSLTRSTPEPATLDPIPAGSGGMMPVYAAPAPIELLLPPLEDAESIQLSLSLVVAAIATNRLDPRRAHMLLYGLQLASANVRTVNLTPFAGAVVRRTVQTKSGHTLAPPETHLTTS